MLYRLDSFIKALSYTAQKRRAEYPEYAGRVVGGAGMSFCMVRLDTSMAVQQFYRAHLDVYIVYEILRISPESFLYYISTDTTPHDIKL